MAHQRSIRLSCDAIDPAASVSGFYFSHPQSQYFNAGLIGEDQLRDYVARRTEADVKCSLVPVIVGRVIATRGLRRAGVAYIVRTMAQ